MERRWVDFDGWSIILAGLLILGGLLAILSATIQSRELYYFRRQLMWVGIGFIVFLLFLIVSYEKWLRWSIFFYIMSVGLLIATLFFGARISGSKSWLVFGPIHIQSSEFAKLAVSLFLARIIGDRSPDQFRKFRFSDFLLVTCITGLPAGLILLQPDFGSALTFIAPCLVLWFLLRMPLKIWLSLFLLIALLFPLGWRHLKPYQRARIAVFLQKEGTNVRGPAYQVYQSKIALGSGGFWGKGFQKGSQTQLGFVPERHTDFIMTTIGEEWGFLGVFLVLVFFLLLFHRWTVIAEKTPDPAGKILVLIILSFWAFHFFINVGMVIGWAPVTGLPLPLVSYGGSFMLFCLSSLALVMNVYWFRHIMALRLS